MDNITALDEGVYKCEITYTKVHEGCNIVQFINLTTYSKSENRLICCITKIIYKFTEKLSKKILKFANNFVG